MGPLARWSGTLAVPVILLASCATAPRPSPEPLTAPIIAPTAPHPSRPLMPSQTFPVPQIDLPRVSGTDPLSAPLRSTEVADWVRASALDLESWPFGWVGDPTTTRILSLPERFWSNQKQRWREALGSSLLSRRALVLNRVFEAADAPEESLRAAWWMAQTLGEAGLRDQARTWLDRAASLSSAPAIALERSWDQAFRLSDLVGARELWKGWSGGSDPESDRKARLLRQKLFGGTEALAVVGADDYISALILDRDDVWASTWNGAVVRWSLATDTVESILASNTVAPIKLLVSTEWFVYAFQDQVLLRYSKVTGEWRSFPYPAGWTGLRVQGVVARGEQSLWVASLGQGLWQWDAGVWTLVDDGGGGPFLNALADDGEGGLWVGTKDRGLWSWKAGTWVSLSGSARPSNISLIEPDPDPQHRRWFIGTWGEGTWILENGTLHPWSMEPDFVTAAAWTARGPLWGALDLGLVEGQGSERTVWGPQDGFPPGGVSALVVWEGRWIWGTNGQGWGWWREYENPTLFR